MIACPACGADLARVAEMMVTGSESLDCLCGARVVLRRAIGGEVTIDLGARGRRAKRRR